MSELANALFFQLRFNLGRCVGLGALLLVVLVTASANTKVGLNTDQTLPLWAKFIPVAQLGIALSLAYLALPFFRHMTTFASKAGDVVGKNTVERQAFAEDLSNRTKAQNDRVPDLNAMVSVFHLFEAQASGKRGQPYPPGMPLDLEGKAAVAVGAQNSWEAWNQVRRLYDDLAKSSCMRANGSRSRFIKTYFVAADFWVVIWGAVFAAAVHVFDLTESILPTYPTPFLRSQACQAIIAILLLVWSCGAPIYFALQGRRVTESFDEFVAAASRQKQFVVQGDEETARNRVEKLFERIVAELGSVDPNNAPSEPPSSSGPGSDMPPRNR